MEFLSKYRKNLSNQRKVNRAKEEERVELNNKFKEIMMKIPLDKKTNQVLVEEEYEKLIEICNSLCPEEMKNIVSLQLFNRSYRLGTFSNSSSIKNN